MRFFFLLHGSPQGAIELTQFSQEATLMFLTFHNCFNFLFLDLSLSLSLLHFTPPHLKSKYRMRQSKVFAVVNWILIKSNFKKIITCPAVILREPQSRILYRWLYLANFLRCRVTFDGFSHCMFTYWYIFSLLHYISFHSFNLVHARAFSLDKFLHHNNQLPEDVLSISHLLSLSIYRDLIERIN